MMMKTVTIILMTLSLTLSLIENPLTLGMWILAMALLATVLIVMTSSSWMAMMAFLIYIGGLLILFAYFLAIQPNNFTNITSPLIIALSSALVLTTTSKSFNPHTTPTNNSLTFTQMILYHQNLSFLILLGLTLLLILVVVVTITFNKSGPLRPFSQVN